MEVEVPTQPISISLPAKFRLFPPKIILRMKSLSSVFNQLLGWNVGDGSSLIVCIRNNMTFKISKDRVLVNFIRYFCKAPKKRKRKLWRLVMDEIISASFFFFYSFFVSNSRYTIILKGSSSKKRYSPEQGTINTL